MCHNKLQPSKVVNEWRKIPLKIVSGGLKAVKLAENVILVINSCCVFRPANRCSAHHSLVKINFLTLNFFLYFLVNKCIK